LVARSPRTCQEKHWTCCTPTLFSIHKSVRLLVVWDAKAQDEESRVPELTSDFECLCQNVEWPHFCRRPARLPGMDGAPNLGHWKQWWVLSKLKVSI
jgi:hypothetical protein